MNWGIVISNDENELNVSFSGFCKELDSYLMRIQEKMIWPSFLSPERVYKDLIVLCAEVGRERDDDKENGTLEFIKKTG